MLIIDNIEKIKQYPFNVHWRCDSVRETDTFYHFVVERLNIEGKICDVRRITLSRVDIPNMDENELCYELYLDDRKLNQLVTTSYLKSINNLVNKFTEILRSL
jgi:hypothetical protein